MSFGDGVYEGKPVEFKPSNRHLVLSGKGAADLLSRLGISCIRKDGKYKNLSTVLREVRKRQGEMGPELWDALIEKLKQEEEE